MDPGRHDHRAGGHLATPTLLRLVTSGQIDAARFITHRFGLDEFLTAYDVFADAASTGALKVLLSR